MSWKEIHPELHDHESRWSTLTPVCPHLQPISLLSFSPFSRPTKGRQHKNLIPLSHALLLDIRDVDEVVAEVHTLLVRDRDMIRYAYRTRLSSGKRNRIKTVVFFLLAVQ